MLLLATNPLLVLAHLAPNSVTSHKINFFFTKFLLAFLEQEYTMSSRGSSENTRAEEISKDCQTW